MLFPGLSKSLLAYGQAPGRTRIVLPCTVAGGWFFVFQNKVLFSIKKLSGTYQAQSLQGQLANSISLATEAAT